ncbi:MAG: hypothetical protein KJ042_05675 [Deltaproteobacteria bacterium]|nr:hypothetical protein [Deltaproteobacteria bacterium]
MSETTGRVCKRHGNPANGMGQCEECYAENGAKKRATHANAKAEGRMVGGHKHRLVLTGSAARDITAYARTAAVVKKSSEAYQTLVLLIGERVIEHVAEDIDD